MELEGYLNTHMSEAHTRDILNYLDRSGCELLITRPRKTKRGDFRTYKGKHRITVNQDPNHFRFLFTLVHEIAHLKTHLDHGSKAKPHGQEWKTNFRFLFQLFRMDEVFAQEPSVYHAVKQELERPKACSGVNLALEKAMTLADVDDGIYLEDLPLGSRFFFRANHYEKLADRRTRVLCLNLKNQRQYTINKAARVKPCE